MLSDRFLELRKQATKSYALNQAECHFGGINILKQDTNVFFGLFQCDFSLEILAMYLKIVRPMIVVIKAV